jgi:hypothetical protein
MHKLSEVICEVTFFLTVLSFDSFVVACQSSISPQASIQETWRRPAGSGLSLLYPYLHMRKSVGKPIMAGCFLLRVDAVQFCGVEARAVYNPPSTQVQHYQHGSHV